MGLIGLTLAMALPWLCGVAWLRLGWRAPGAGAWPTVLGYGYILGLLATTMVMRACDLIHIRFGFGTVGFILAALTALALWLGRGQPWRGWGRETVTGEWQALSDGQKLLFVLLAMLIAVRLLGLGLEVASRPLLPWDAWTQWTTKARVWYELGRLAPFVNAETWLDGAEPMAFTDAVPFYPGTVPLIQAWAAFGFGGWDETASNLPWLLCAVALGLAFYGQARALGVASLAAMVFTYFLLSLPFLDVHVALAGYPDLFMGTIYALAAMAFMRWARDRERRQGVVALLLALSCALIKRPGLVWMVTFVPALWVALMPRAGLAGIVAIGFAGVGVLNGGLVSALFPGYGIDREAHPVWGPLLRNLFAMDNWHLLWYLVVLVVGLSVFRLLDRNLRAATVLMASGVGFLGVVFFYSSGWIWVKDYTIINRAILHLAPAMLFYVMSICHERGWLALPGPK